MDVQTLMTTKDSLTERGMQKIDTFFDLMQDTIISTYNFLNNTPSIIPIILWAIISFITNNFLVATICSCIIYISAMIGKFIKHKIWRGELEVIDLDEIGLTLDTENALKKRSVTDLVGEYVEDCFNRDVIFFRPSNVNDYIDETEQNNMLSDLLDSAASNLSHTARQKIIAYIGEDALNRLIARKALSIITAFAANRNKKIYGTKPLNKK